MDIFWSQLLVVAVSVATILLMIVTYRFVFAKMMQNIEDSVSPDAPQNISQKSKTAPHIKKRDIPQENIDEYEGVDNDGGNENED